MLNVAIIGATGYTGIELIKILVRHPHVHLTALTTRQKENIPVHALAPSLPKGIDLEIKTYSFPDISRKADLVFLCLPHTEAMDTAQKFRKAGKVVIDLSADFRLRSKKIYESWYGVKHTNPVLLKEAVYGLPEFNRKLIQKADLVSNPGCYPTGAILGVAPLLAHRLIEEDAIIIDSKSGVSGAGKKLNPATQFCEVNENFYAYKVGKHQHTPEIEQMLSDVSGSMIKIVFTPHLLPVTRGLLSTIYLKKKRGIRREAVREAFKETYHEEPFVRVKSEGTFPALRDVQHTNYCDIGYRVADDSDEIIVITAIDNLLKGASGQAVQNMNIRCGFGEEEGLR